MNVKFKVIQMFFQMRSHIQVFFDLLFYLHFFVFCFLQRGSQAIVLSGIILPNQLIIFGIHHARHIVRIKLFPLLGHLADFIGQAHNFALCTVDGILHILDFLQFFQNLPFIAQLDNEQMQLIHYQGFQQFFWNLVADALIVGLPCLADVIADLFTFLRSILFIKSDLRLVVDLQNCIKAQQSRAYAQKVKISNLQQMAKTVAYIQEHGYDTQEKLQDTTDTIQSKMAKARSDAKLTEAKLKKVNEQIHYLGQYLSTKSVYADFLKSTNKKDFRQNYADEIAKYEEALQFLKQNSQDGKLPTMKDLRSEKELLVQQKSAQYETYQYFKDYHRELQTVCSNVENILNQPSVQKHATREFTL